MLRVWLTCIVGEVENAEERTERAKACPCPVHARRNRKSHKDRLKVSRWILIRKSFSTKLSFMVRNRADSLCISMSRKSSFIIILYINAGFANFIDKWSHCDFCFSNFGVILEYLESSITTKKAIFRLSSTWSWHVYTIMRDTRSSFGGPLTWKA